MQFELLQKLQSVNQQIQKHARSQTHLPRQKYSALRHELRSIQKQLRHYDLYDRQKQQLIHSLQSLLSEMRRDDSNSHDDKYHSLHKKYMCNKQILQELVELNSPRDTRQRPDDIEECIKKYKCKYTKMKHQYNQLLKIAKSMEEEVCLLQKELEESRQNESDLRIQCQILTEQLSEKEQMLHNVDEKITRYEGQLELIKTIHEDNTSESSAKYNNLKERYEKALKQLRVAQQLQERTEEKYEILCLQFEDQHVESARQAQRIESLLKQLNQAKEIHKQLVSFKESIEIRKNIDQDLERKIAQIAQRQRKINQQLEQQLLVSQKQKNELIEQLKSQKTIAEDVHEIVEIVQKLKKQNNQLKNNKGVKSESKLRIIGELQDMVRMHKLQMKTSRIR